LADRSIKKVAKVAKRLFLEDREMIYILEISNKGKFQK